MVTVTSAIKRPVAARVVWDRVMLAHRRYTSANGDALAGALTYALLVCSAPAVLLVAAAVGTVGVDGSAVRDALRRSADVLLPAEVSGVVDRLPAANPALGLALLAALVWTSLRLVRAIRTGIRAMCGQNAGSGNPVRDAGLDARLGLLLLAGVSVLVVVAAAVDGRWYGPPVAMLGISLLLAGIILCCSWPQPGRPGVAAAMRAALVAAVVVELLTLLAGRYFSVTAALHGEVYRAAGGLVGVLVWCSLVCRTLLRATAWASTAHSKGDRDGNA